MNTVTRDLYFTPDHEWIDFQGSVAYVGVCLFKLSGIKQIQKIAFAEYSDYLKQGEVIATIHYDDYQIPVHMPIDGKIISINEMLLTGDEHILLQQPELNGWVALVVPSQHQERNGLLQAEEYRLLQGNVSKVKY